MAKRKTLINFRGGRSQAEMGEKYGVSQQAWCKYENALATPSYEIMSKIAKDAGKSIEQIFFADNDNLLLSKKKTRQKKSKLA